MKFMQNIVLLLLLSSSCWADGQPQPNQQSVQPEQSHSLTVGENVSKNVAGVVDKSQNKRGAPDIPVVVGTPTQHTAYINHHVTGATVVAAPISGHSTHAAIGAVPFGYGHAVSSAGHILQTPSIATGHQHVIHKVNYVAPASTTTLKLATVSEGSHLHLQPVSSVVTKYNYAVPQLSYAHYPQYQVYHHNQPSPGTLQPTGTTIFAAHQLHDHPVATVHEIAHQHHPQQQQQQHQQQQHQQQQHTAYAHQQPIYAHHPAAIHFTVPASVVHAGQHNYQQQQQLPLTHTQAIHYQANQAGGQPAVPIVHQAPIATINQVHQAQQVYAAQGQLTKYPLAAQSYYGAGGLQQNQIYSTVPSYAFHQHGAGGAGKQLLPTVATPVHLKPLVPVTTTTTTQHHGNGISYTAFTQPSHAASISVAAHLKPVPQSILQTPPSYYNAAASTNVQQQQQQQQTFQPQPNVFYRNQLQQQQQQQQQQAQQQQRVQIYSTAASPLQKAPLVYSAAGQFSHPVPSQYATYGYAPQQHHPVAAGALFQPQAALGKLTYAQNSGSAGVGARGPIYLLH
ncbi:uncharacterized protein LOC11175544 isoform X2 [Anopheles gambiae]|uniref:uncharacterized protein LOC11175544 isoform X2 n=1 Tax=Anopheles gambiae TaxID=7165 RepID=UPI002AC8D718|nr:uncharacterized protein LOC11175544 isoform X2 [Anopheles gambiae]